VGFGKIEKRGTPNSTRNRTAKVRNNKDLATPPTTLLGATTTISVTSSRRAKTSRMGKRKRVSSKKGLGKNVQ